MTTSNHNRHSFRLRGYDYSRAGLYFVTICVKNRLHLFGDVCDGEMVLNDAGKMIEKWCSEISTKFADITLGEYIIMPNHFHAIIINHGNDVTRRRGGPACPPIASNCDNGYQGEHVGSPLHRVIQWFKTMTTNEYIRNVKTSNWKPFAKKLWQRNYHEHIIRNNHSHKFIVNYIANNPKTWETDRFNLN